LRSIGLLDISGESMEWVIILTLGNGSVKIISNMHKMYTVCMYAIDSIKLQYRWISYIEQEHFIGSIF